MPPRTKVTQQLMFTSCTEYRSLMERHIDGSLNEAEQAQLQAHAQVCEGCRRELAWLQATAIDLEKLGDEAVGKARLIDVRAAVLDQIRTGEAGREVASDSTVTSFRSRRRIWPRVFAAAAALAVAALGLVYLMYSEGGFIAPVAERPVPPASNAPAEEGAGATPGMTPDASEMQTAQAPTPSP
ncbi:MAG: zf-HC2 domain-containing protein, partial [Candidatus Hydrogenedentales bacterium]